MNTTVRSSPCDKNDRYPAPHVPMLPTMSLSMAGKRVAGDFDSRFFAMDCLFLPSGRAALAIALRELQCGPGDVVLLPAYHCESMVAPVRWLGAEPVFFRLQPDLSPDIEDLKSRLTPAVRAIVVVHYFGFLQDVAGLRRWCDDHDVALIEDCAHAFFGHRRYAQPGAAGHYAIASSRKFFPGADGGMLVADQATLSAIELRSPGWSAQFKSYMACIQCAANAGKLGVASRALSTGLAFVDRLRREGVSGRTDELVGDLEPNPAGIDCWFDPDEMRRTGRAVSRRLMRRSDVSRVTGNRRRNYTQLLHGLADIAHARPLYEQLPGTVVPYVFPWIIDDPKTRFPALKQAGVPMYRWEVLAKSDCTVSADYQYRLLQLPCHQELGPSELAWLIDRCRRLLGAS